MNDLIRAGFAYFRVDHCVRRSGAATEVAKLPVVVNTEENVLRLDVSVSDRWVLHVHV